MKDLYIPQNIIKNKLNKNYNYNFYNNKIAHLINIFNFWAELIILNNNKNYNYSADIDQFLDLLKEELDLSEEDCTIIYNYLMDL